MIIIYIFQAILKFDKTYFEKKVITITNELAVIPTTFIISIIVIAGSAAGITP